MENSWWRSSIIRLLPFLHTDALLFASNPLTRRTTRRMIETRMQKFLFFRIWSIVPRSPSRIRLSLFSRFFFFFFRLIRKTRVKHWICRWTKTLSNERTCLSNVDSPGKIDNSREKKRIFFHLFASSFSIHIFALFWKTHACASNSCRWNSLEFCFGFT